MKGPFSIAGVSEGWFSSVIGLLAMGVAECWINVVVTHPGRRDRELTLLADEGEVTCMRTSKQTVSHASTVEPMLIKVYVKQYGLVLCML